MAGFTITRWADDVLVGEGDAVDGQPVDIDIIGLTVPWTQFLMLVNGQVPGVIFRWDEEEP